MGFHHDMVQPQGADMENSYRIYIHRQPTWCGPHKLGVGQHPNTIKINYELSKKA